MLGIFNLGRRLLRRPPSLPRQFPTSGFQILDVAQPIEEETFSWYDPTNYYPVRIGDVYKSYQVVGKLGYGGYSTVWLCRDLTKHCYTVMKVCTRIAPDIKREVEAYRRINSVSSLLRHHGRRYVRKMLDEFELTDEMSILAILLALDFLHNHAKLIHTDLQENNIILELSEDAPLGDFEEQELNDPSPRKIVGDRVIYTSREMKLTKTAYGPPVLCDFGQARSSEVQHSGEIQPYQYRAPEVIFGMKWDEKVDIWNLGVMIWDMYMGDNMFNVSGGPDNEEADVYHLAHMVALLGPPPVDFLRRCTTDIPWEYFDEEGNWKGAAEVPHTSFEERMSEADDIDEEDEDASVRHLFMGKEDRAEFLRFLNRMLKWRPEDRPTAGELLQDSWIKPYEKSFD
ncbi:putative CDK4/6 [Fistulina hepatica ATCC 64428]|uniref:Putative CDK4/6 n=1 Tax=Fistulina hepatica ATCC 64428 TaxID=1128425 RepID=A0A0D7AGS0_9AGAR|nr:putative CDK4/6 [Fistulina hepatica ATCC 64428]